VKYIKKPYERSVPCRQPHLILASSHPPRQILVLHKCCTYIPRRILVHGRIALVGRPRVGSPRDYFNCYHPLPSVHQSPSAATPHSLFRLHRSSLSNLRHSAAEPLLTMTVVIDKTVEINERSFALHISRRWYVIYHLLPYSISPP